MLSRFFLISTLFFVGITAIATGTPVVEIIEAIKIPQANLTLNRRFGEGIPGLPQCTDAAFPSLVYSFCFTPLIIQARCTNYQPPGGSTTIYTPCPPDTTCMDFQARPDAAIYSPFDVFAACVDEKSIKRYDNDGKEGVFCKTYKIDGVTGGTATLSFDISDINQQPVRVSNVKFTTGNQSGSKLNTYNYSSIVDVKNGQKMQMCMDVAVAGIVLFARYTLLDGSYSLKS